MTNQIPRALLADIVLSISIGDIAGAAAMLGPDDDACRSAAVPFYRALVRRAEGRLEEALRYAQEARRMVETRYWEATPALEKILKEAMENLPAPETPFAPALEAIMPQLVRVRILRFEAKLLSELGRRNEALERVRMLPAAAAPDL